MNQFFKKALALSTLACVVTADAASAVSSVFVPRSQSRNKVRQVVGVVNDTHLHDQDGYYGLFSVTPEYTQSFRSGKIAHCLFGDDIIGSSTNGSCDDSCNSVIKIQGSTVANRDAKAWLADYFYMAPDFDGTISFSPRIRNFLVDFDFYIGLDPWLCGTYFRLYGPVVNTRWDLRFCETGKGSNGYDEGYFGPDAIANSALNQKFSEYAAGKAPVVTGLTFNSLRFGKIANCNTNCDDSNGRNKTGFADLRMELGWNFLQDCDYHLGLNIQAAAPTGTKQHAEYLFNPVVGNGKHWELGAGLTGHYIFWNCENESKHFGFYLDANITHLFKATQQRTFDLVGKPNSRYALAEKLGTPIVDNLFGAVGAVATDATAQFKNEYTPVANLTTADVKVSASVQADVVAFFNYTSCNWSFDLGYNFWARSCEDIQCPEVCNTSCNTTSLFDSKQANTWALKGDARVYGFASPNTTQGALAADTPVALSATEKDANIHTGSNIKLATVAGEDQLYRNNRGVDNPQSAAAESAAAVPSFLNYNRGLGTAAAARVFTSIQPVFLKASDINTCASTRGLSHKVFTHVSYKWDRECWSPFFGIGGEAEFGKNDSNCNSSSSCNTSSCSTSSDCNDCSDCSLSQWGIWLKAGLSFN